MQRAHPSCQPGCIKLSPARRLPLKRLLSNFSIVGWNSRGPLHRIKSNRATNLPTSWREINIFNYSNATATSPRVIIYFFIVSVRERSDVCVCIVMSMSHAHTHTDTASGRRHQPPAVKKDIRAGNDDWESRNYKHARAWLFKLRLMWGCHVLCRRRLQGDVLNRWR